MFNIDKEVPHCGLDLSPLPGLLKYLMRFPGLTPRATLCRRSAAQARI